MLDRKNYSLRQHNTFGIDARCRRFIAFDSKEELQQALSTLTPQDEPFVPLGEGSNLLLTKDFEGTVLHSRIQFVDIKIEDSIATVKAGSGVIWDDLVAACVEQKAYGLENLSLIPGTVGAAAVQNIGAYGCEVKDFIQTITAVEITTGHEVTFTNADCQYAYRYSKFKGEWKNKYVIISVELKFNCTYSPHLDYGNIQSELQRKGIEHPTPQQLRDTIIAIRQAKLPDPKVQGNAGSFFMNPIVGMQQYQELAVRYPQMPHYQIDGLSVKIPAGWLIEQCGWKGKTLGRAGVHDKQALVLVNRGGASGSDIERLCKEIQKDVSDRFGIAIHPEVNIL